MEESSLGGVSFSGDAVGSERCPRHSTWSGRYEQVSKLLEEVLSAKVKAHLTRRLRLWALLFQVIEK